MERVVGLVNKLQQICSSLGETALSENAVLWNKLTTIVVVGGQARALAARALGEDEEDLKSHPPWSLSTLLALPGAELGQELRAGGGGGERLPAPGHGHRDPATPGAPAR